MPLDAKEVLTILEEERKRFGPWFDRMQAMYEMVNPRKQGVSARARIASPRQLTPEAVAVRDYASQYVSARMAAIHQNYMGRIISGTIRADAATIADSRAEQESQAGLERWSRGVIAEQDARVFRSARGTSWRKQAASYSSCPGKMINRVHLTESPESPESAGAAMVTWDLLDPMTCMHDFDASPRHFAREFKMARRKARALLWELEMPEPVGIKWDEKETLTCVEWWHEEPTGERRNPYRVYRGFLVDEKMAALRESEFRRIPIVIACINASPGVPIPVRQQTGQEGREMSTEDMLYHAQPLYAALEHIHNIFQDFMSLGMEELAWQLNKPIIVHQEGQKVTLNPDIFGPGQTLLLPEGVRIQKGLDGPTIGNIDAVLRAFTLIVDQEADRVFPSVLFGQGGTASSGYQDWLQSSHAGAVFADPTAGIAGLVKNSLIETLEQWKLRDDLTLPLRGKIGGGVDAGNVHIEEFSIKDMPKQPALEITVSADLPENKQGNMLLAINGVKSGLVDKQMARGSIVNIHDALAVQDRIDQEMVHDSEPMVQERILDSFYQSAEAAEEEAARTTDRVKKVKLLREAYRWRGRAEVYEAALTGAVRQPRQGRGIKNPPPDQLPTELGPRNPDQQAAAEGRPNAYTGGPGPSSNGNRQGATIP